MERKFPVLKHATDGFGGLGRQVSTLERGG
jgi:hypothetical protein